MASRRVARHASCSKADPGEAGWLSLLPCRIGISDSGDRGKGQGERHRLGRPPSLAAYLSNHPEHLLRNITAELKLGAMGRRFDPLNSRRIERTAQEVSEFVPT